MAIEAACRDGCRHYHMGESLGSSALSEFKSNFGARAYEYAEYWIERAPIYRAEKAVRNGIKRAIGFRDA
jgi:hypothetical protein